MPAIRRFRVVGIFETGFFEVDDNWAFTSIAAAQKMLSLADVVNRIEIKVDDLDRVAGVRQERSNRRRDRATRTTTWKEQNKQLLDALNMERIVTIITIGLIELVAALNIFITLVMMVMEKYRDIAVLMSMGARSSQIRWIFMLQGVLIGVVGSIIGLIAGYTLCYFADKLPLDRARAAIYALSYVPFQPRALDGSGSPRAAILVSFLATHLSRPQRHQDRARRGAAVRITGRRILVPRRKFSS